MARNHPQPGDRIADAQHEIDTLLPPEAEYKLNTSEFDDVKERLAQLQNRHKIDKDHGGDGPTLRRASHTGATDTGNDGDVDERPTLKHRDNTSQ